MPRIAFIDYFPTHYRRRLYEEIARRADADFYFFSDERERWSDPKIPVAARGDYRRVELSRYRFAGESVMPGVLTRILSGRYDAVIKSPNGKLMLPLVYGAAKASQTGFVLWLGMWSHPRSTVHRVSKPLMEGVYRGAEAIVAYGTHVRAFAIETPGVDPAKVFVAGQAVDPTAFSPVPGTRPDGPPEVLFIGQFKAYKGLSYLLDAWDRLPRTGARLRLVGGGPLLDWVRDRASGREDIELLGYRTQEQLPAEFARARCLVLPSVTTTMDREPWGLVVNEAFHSGVPVIASDAVGAAAGGLVVDRRNGLVVPERDAVSLAAAIRSLIDNRALAAQMGEAARVDVAAFNYDRMADAFLAAAQYAAAARSRAR